VAQDTIGDGTEEIAAAGNDWKILEQVPNLPAVKTKRFML
jgi:hypothetical protein